MILNYSRLLQLHINNIIQTKTTKNIYCQRLLLQTRTPWNWVGDQFFGTTHWLFPYIKNPSSEIDLNTTLLFHSHLAPRVFPLFIYSCLQSRGIKMSLQHLPENKAHSRNQNHTEFKLWTEKKMKSVPLGYRKLWCQIQTHLALPPWAWEAASIYLQLFRWNEIFISIPAANQSPARTAKVNRNHWLGGLCAAVKKSRILRNPTATQ